MFDSEEEIGCYQDLILAEHANLESNAFSFEVAESRLADSQIDGICSASGIRRKDLEKSGLLIAYPDGGFRTMHMDLIYRALNSRAASWSNKIPLEFKLVRPIEELMPSFQEKQGIELRSILNLNDELKEILLQALRDAGYETLAFHQVHYLSRILGRNDKCYLLVSPTASGKSLIFYITVLASVLAKLDEKGTRAIIVYPRKALASDQLQKFMKVVYALNSLLAQKGKRQITLGIDDGDTPRSSSSEDVKRNEIYRGLKCADRTCAGSLRYAVGKSGAKITCEKCQRVYNEIIATKGDIWNLEPRILFTNLSSLNRRLMTKASQSIVGSTVEWIVLDEAHVYREEVGGHARWLLRRILSRFEVLTKGDVRFIVSSATIHNPKGFVEKLLGITELIYYEDYSKILAVSKTKRKKLAINVIIAPNPLRSAESLAEELALLLGVWGFAYGKKSVVFIDNISEVERMKDFVVNDIIIDREAQNDHISVAKTPSVSDVSESFSWVGLSNGLKSIGSTEFARTYDHHYAELDSEERARVEESFKNRKSGVLFATSTLELGMDIGNIASVVQYKIPLTAESYVQRIGRAGRSNEVGRIALGFLVLTNAPSQIRYVLESEYKRLIEPQVEIPVAWENEEIRKQHAIFSVLDYEAAKRANTFLDFTTEVRPNWSDVGDALRSLKQIILDARKNIGVLHDYQEGVASDGSSTKILDDVINQIEKKVDFGLANYSELSGMDVDESLTRLRRAEDRILKAKRELENELSAAKKLGASVSAKELNDYDSSITNLLVSLSKVLGDMERLWS